jgi:hypothetical protein
MPDRVERPERWPHAALLVVSPARHHALLAYARTPYGMWSASMTTSVPTSIVSCEMTMTVSRPNCEYGPGFGSLVVLSTLRIACPAPLTERSFEVCAADWFR